MLSCGVDFVNSVKQTTSFIQMYFRHHTKEKAEYLASSAVQHAIVSGRVEIAGPILDKSAWNATSWSILTHRGDWTEKIRTMRTSLTSPNPTNNICVKSVYDLVIHAVIRSHLQPIVVHNLDFIRLITECFCCEYICHCYLVFFLALFIAHGSNLNIKCIGCCC